MDKFNFAEPDDLNAGWALIGELQKEQVPIRAAMWLRASEADTWKFHILSPAVMTFGPLYLYKKIGVILDRCENKIPINFDDISVANTTNSVASAIYRAFPKAKTVSYLKNIDVDGHQIKDAYIYNVRQTKLRFRKKK